MLSSTARAAWPAAGHLHPEDSASWPLREPRLQAQSRWSAALRHVVGARRPAHPVFIDGRGVWAWSAHESHAPATRYASLQAWIAANPHSEMNLWVSGHLMRGEQADPAAALDDDPMLGLLAQQARHHGARLRSIAPWWSHAFRTAAQCVGMLRSAERAAVCIVEGTHMAWVATSHGAATQVQQRTLEAASVAALRHAIARVASEAGTPVRATVILGQGLVDGARTQALGGVVLGRLDGEQPPQWLRPSLGVEMY